MRDTEPSEKPPTFGSPIRTAKPTPAAKPAENWKPIQSQPGFVRDETTGAVKRLGFGEHWPFPMVAPRAESTSADKRVLSAVELAAALNRALLPQESMSGGLVITDACTALALAAPVHWGMF